MKSKLFKDIGITSKPLMILWGNVSTTYGVHCAFAIMIHDKHTNSVIIIFFIFPCF